MARDRQPDILVVGGGLGGVAATLAAARLGMRVLLTEETDWIGGQLTVQAVPPDEHPWIEGTGCTPTYQRLRRAIRDYYRRNYPLLPDARFDPQLNPGLGRVSPLCHEPRVALLAMYELLAPYLTSGRVTMKLRCRPVAAHVDGDRVRAVTLRDAAGTETTIEAAYILDATELGDLLELAEIEHVIGAESQAETGEPHALAGDADPLDQQAVTACFAMDYLPDEDHTTERPEDYGFWRTYRADFWPGPQLGWLFVDPVTLDVRRQGVFEESGREDLWGFRRIFYKGHFPAGHFASDISLVNWPQNDYWLGPLVGVSAEERAANERAARQLSLSFLHWMQTEAPRHDGGFGYPGLRLRGDVVGTHDGLAKHVYVRESRRIRAELTVLEQHVAVEARGKLEGAEPFPDSVGIGSYRIDLHPSTRGRTYVDISSWPFQIPLGALIPIRVENVLPAAKNLGVTHITNGCYRLHPVEWSIGEAAGALAAYCLRNGVPPRHVRSDAKQLAQFQHLLHAVLGIPLVWPNPRATIR
ncbi:MAG: FAD-dependent oxidoreductase [Deltaproteobacteria bacterium]|nr:FAD-dependent oxidoreductase [Kofleriaceae bacterium]